MLIASVQNIPKRYNYNSSNRNFSALKKTILKDEVSFGSKKKPDKSDVKRIEEEPSNLSKEGLNANDGINDIDDNSLKTSKSDLNTATDGISMQRFLEKENEALKNQDINLKHLEIDYIDIPKIDIPDLELENFDKDIKRISEVIDKPPISSILKSFLPELGAGVIIVGAIHYFLKKNKKHNKSLSKQV